ncbi:MAG: hypothetical protein QM775_01700 [Pirellulales bacterium]
MEKEIPVKKLLFSLSAAMAFGFAGQASAQYNAYAAQQPGRYAPAAQAHYAPAQQGYGVQPVSTAMRPGTTTYAASPAVGLKPVNAPSQATQRILMASRTSPTPAPTQTASAAKQPIAPPQQYWNSGVNASPWESSQGASYGAPQADAISGGGYAGGAPAGGGQCCGNGGGAVGGDCGGDSCGCARAAAAASVATAACVRPAIWCSTCPTSARRTATTTSARTT